MKVSFFAPQPGTRSGIADYAASLERVLLKNGVTKAVPGDGDVALYHLGNNQLHREIYERAVKEPGVVVLHDAVLQHFFLGALDEAEYVEEFVFNYGEWSRELGRKLWQGRAASGPDQRYFAYPMLRRIAERSLAVIVHNQRAGQMVREHQREARVFDIPHFFEGPERAVSVEEIRRFRERWLGDRRGVDVAGQSLTPDAFLFSVFGYLRESKRILTVIESFNRLRRVRPNAALLLAGQVISADLSRALEAFREMPGLFRTGHLTEREFWIAAAATDVCVNLRYPSAGETSGISIRLMGSGKPVMVTESPEVAVFEGVCIPIRSGLGEGEALFEWMVGLSGNPGIATAMGRMAQRRIHEKNALDKVSGRYLEVLQAAAASLVRA